MPSTNVMLFNIGWSGLLTSLGFCSIQYANLYHMDVISALPDDVPASGIALA